MNRKYSEIQKSFQYSKNTINLHAPFLAPPLLTLQVINAHVNKNISMIHMICDQCKCLFHEDVIFETVTGPEPTNTLEDFQLHLRIGHSDDTCHRGYKTSKPNDAWVGPIDPHLVQGDQDVTEVLHCVQKQGRMLLQRSE